jgi:hypothetical protein
MQEWEYGGGSDEIIHRIDVFEIENFAAKLQIHEFPDDEYAPFYDLELNGAIFMEGRLDSKSTTERKLEAMNNVKSILSLMSDSVSMCISNHGWSRCF